MCRVLFYAQKTVHFEISNKSVENFRARHRRAKAAQLAFSAGAPKAAQDTRTRGAGWLQWLGLRPALYFAPAYRHPPCSRPPPPIGSGGERCPLKRDLFVGWRTPYVLHTRPSSRGGRAPAPARCGCRCLRVPLRHAFLYVHALVSCALSGAHRLTRCQSVAGPPPRSSALGGPPPLLALPAHYVRAPGRCRGLRERGCRRAPVAFTLSGGSRSRRAAPVFFRLTRAPPL